MAFFLPLIAALSLGAQIGGTLLSADAQKDASEASKKAEGLRNNLAMLQEKRAKRQVIREATIAKAESLNTAVEQGAQFGSGLQGGQAQITGIANQSIQGISENAEITQGLFKNNAQVSEARGRAATGAAISSLGGSALSNTEQIGRIGTFVAGRTF